VFFFETDDLTPEIGAVKGYYFSQAVDPECAKFPAWSNGNSFDGIGVSRSLINSQLFSSRDQEFAQMALL